MRAFSSRRAPSRRRSQTARCRPASAASAALGAGAGSSGSSSAKRTGSRRAGQPAQDAPVGVEHLEHDLPLRFLGEPVVDDRAVGGILAGALERRAPVAAAPPAPRRPRVEELDRLGAQRVAPAAQRRQVVEDPERAAARGEDQVAVADLEVDHGDRRQVEPERLPAAAAVARHRDAPLVAEEEQPFALRVLAHDEEVDVLRQPRREALPGAAPVAGAPEVGAVVVEPVGVDHDVGGAGGEGRGLDRLDRRPLGQALRRDVRPGGAAVARKVDQAVVGADPERARVERRLGDREDGVVDLDAGVVAGDRPARPLLLGLVVAGEVGAHGGPGGAAVGRAEEHLGAVVEDRRVVRARAAIGAVHWKRWRSSTAPWPEGLVGIGGDHARLAARLVVVRDVAAVLAGVDLRRPRARRRRSRRPRRRPPQIHSASPLPPCFRLLDGPLAVPWSWMVPPRW